MIRFAPLLIFASMASADIAVDSLQLFTNAVPGQIITLAQLTNSSRGAGTWRYLNDIGTEFESWYVVSNSPVAFPTPVTLTNGEVYTQTSDRWLRWTNNTGREVESMGFDLPGGPSAPGSYLTVRLFIRFCTTNLDNEFEGLDHVDIVGNPQGILQQQTGGGNPRALAHASTGANGGYIFYTTGKTYFSVIRFDATAKTVRISIYDAEDNFALLGTSQGSWTGFIGNPWRVRFQANYLQSGPYANHTSGYTEITAPMFSYTTNSLDLGGSIIQATTVNAANTRIGGQ